MQIFTVAYTTTELVGNDCDTMQIEAENLAAAYEYVDEHYPELMLDTIYPS